MTKFSKLVVGEILSETQYYKVEKVVGKQVQLKPEAGKSIVVDDQYVDDYLTSADQFEKQETINLTNASTMILANPGVVMTINYNKKVDEKEVVTEVMKEVSGATLSGIETAIKKAVKKSIIGGPRTIKGRHFGELNELGRLNFIDMEKDKDVSKTYDSRQRQVDTRTTNWFILKGVKYTVK